MKPLVLSLMLICYSAVAIAENDPWVGSYRALDGNGTASISKKVETEATLFEPATYSYEVRIVRAKDSIDRKVKLILSKDGSALTGSNSDDCDSPDCHAFDTFEVTVGSAKNKLILVLNYEGYIAADKEDDIKRFRGSAIFIKE